MSDLSAPTLILIAAMLLNGVWTIPFGVLASRSFRRHGKLTPALAIWSGVAMHGHAVMTFAMAWLDRGGLYAPNTFYIAIGGFLVLGGAYVIYLGRKAYGDQTRVYGLKEDELITQGIYRRSRNPQYFGYGIMFLGAAFASGSGLAFIFVAVFALMVHAGITLIEEPHLHRVFGTAYTNYRITAGRYFKMIHTGSSLRK